MAAVTAKTQDLVKKIRTQYLKSIEECPPRDFKKSVRWQEREGMLGWEVFSVPEENHYETVLATSHPGDVIFDVGAGDLRLDLMLCERVKRVYAIEINPLILASALDTIGYDIPKNLVVIRANAFDLELPPDVTKILCLMIHREHDFPESWCQKKIIIATHAGLFYACDSETQAVKLS